MLREMNAHEPDDEPSTPSRRGAPSGDGARAEAAGSAPLAAFSGEPGAFAEDAVHAYFGPATTTLAVGGFRAVFEAVVARRAAAGVVPIENLVNGTVRENYDLLLEFPLEIRGEVVVPVHLCLAALPGERLETVERVYSHVQALGQADSFLRTRPWTLLTTYNTAGAGKSIVERGERGAAAVLSPRAAARFGLEILADGIESVPENRTRFLVVAAPGVELPAPAPGATAPDGAMRTTLVLGVRNEPGTLLRCLAVFAAHGLNLSSLESRPAHDRPWDYVFWVDLDADAATPATRAALAELSAVTTLVRVLGSYRQGAGG
jgi:prephenate dehydratase